MKAPDIYGTHNKTALHIILKGIVEVNEYWYCSKKILKKPLVVSNNYTNNYSGVLLDRFTLKINV